MNRRKEKRKKMKNGVEEDVERGRRKRNEEASKNGKKNRWRSIIAQVGSSEGNVHSSELLDI